jgi:protein-S-isoprenylcysteine O-methyltransferase Ste14
MQELLFIAVTVFWALEFIVFRGNRTATEEANISERYSLPLIFIAISLSVFISALCGHFQWFPATSAWQWLGLAGYAAGVGLRWWGIIKLGRHFSRHIRLQDEMEFVSDGPYRWLRHPLYSGILLAVSGVALALGSWLSLLGVGLFVLPALLHRLRREEQEMTARFGVRYERWRKPRKRLIPFVY